MVTIRAKCYDREKDTEDVGVGRSRILNARPRADPRSLNGDDERDQNSPKRRATEPDSRSYHGCMGISNRRHGMNSTETGSAPGQLSRSPARPQPCRTPYRAHMPGPKPPATSINPPTAKTPESTPGFTHSIAEGLYSLFGVSTEAGAPTESHTPRLRYPEQELEIIWAAKHQYFMAGNIDQKDVSDVPGISLGYAGQLRKIDIITGGDLLKMYVHLGADRKQFVNWLKSMTDANSSQADAAYSTVKEYYETN